MIDKIIFWFTSNCKKIGYALGTFNVLSGIELIIIGQSNTGWVQLFVGSVLIFDAWLML